MDENTNLEYYTEDEKLYFNNKNIDEGDDESIDYEEESDDNDSYIENSDMEDFEYDIEDDIENYERMNTQTNVNVEMNED